MYLPFVEAAESSYIATPLETRPNNAQLVDTVKNSLNGHEKASALLTLFNEMMRQKIDFFTLWTHTSYPELKNSISLNFPLTDLCKDDADGLYFHPDRSGQSLVATDNKFECSSAWSKTLLRVNQFAASAAFQRKP